jgi:hypothetical protein
MKRIEEIEQRYSNFKVVRDKSGQNKKRIRCLELHPSFVEEIKDDWNVMSFGQYLSQLRPFSDDCDRFLKKELELIIGQTLLSTLGKTFGAALLPILGTSSVDDALSNVAASMATYAANKILSDEDIAEVIEDAAALDLELPELIAALNINQKVNSPTSSSDILSALELFKIGEVGHGDLSYHNEEKHEKGFPSPFVIERDFKKFIAEMEEETRKKNGGEYKPDDKSLPPPTPINERVLPDLYLGAGDAKCTHSRRECLENRLVGFLLTRLSHNFYKKLHGEDDLFEVQWNGETCRFPEDLIQAFIENGHKVEVCPKATTACFGTFLCVKEENGFSNIPVCIQLRTGVERSSDSRPSYFIAPHGGLEINITGPLIGTTNYCAIQFYVSAEGLTAFYPNQDVDVPWLERQPLSRMYTNSEAVTAVRMAGMVAHVFNSIGTDMNLPCGGYGILGMCNDSATIIDYAIRGETSAYPLLATGRYLNHIFNYLVDLKNGLKNDPEMGKAVVDLKKLIKSSVEMPTDLHISPSTISDCASRFCATYSKCTFQMTEDSKAVMTEMAEKYKDYSKKK